MPDYEEMTDEEKLTQARAIVIGAMGQTFALYGLCDVSGRIYGLLYFSERALGLEEIATELGVSKATVSINIRVLEECKFVRKIWQKGSRRDYYEAQRSFTKAFMEVIRTNLKKELEITREAIQQSEHVLSEVADAEDVKIRNQAVQHRKWLQELNKQYKVYGRLAGILGMGEKLWNIFILKQDGDT